MTLLGICNLGVGDGRMWLGNHFVWLHLKTVFFPASASTNFDSVYIYVVILCVFFNDGGRWRGIPKIYTAPVTCFFFKPPLD